MDDAESVITASIPVIDDPEAFEAIKSQDGLIVIDAFPPWSLPCYPLGIFPPQYSDVTFVSVCTGEIDLRDDTGKPLPETSEPTILLMLNGKVFQTLHGIIGHELKDALNRYVAMRAASMMTGVDLLSVLPLSAIPDHSRTAGPLKPGRGRRSSSVESNFNNRVREKRGSASAAPMGPVRRRSSGMKLGIRSGQDKRASV